MVTILGLNLFSFEAEICGLALKRYESDAVLIVFGRLMCFSTLFLTVTSQYCGNICKGFFF